MGRRGFIFCLIIIFISGTIGYNEGSESIKSELSGVRSPRSLASIARLLLGGTYLSVGLGNVPANHPLVKYPDAKTSASVNTNVIAAVPGMNNKRPSSPGNSLGPGPIQGDPGSHPFASTSSPSTTTPSGGSNWEETGKAANSYNNHQQYNNNNNNGYNSQGSTSGGFAEAASSAQRSPSHPHDTPTHTYHPQQNPSSSGGNAQYPGNFPSGGSATVQPFGEIGGAYSGDRRLSAASPSPTSYNGPGPIYPQVGFEKSGQGGWEEEAGSGRRRPTPNLYHSSLPGHHGSRHKHIDPSTYYFSRDAVFSPSAYHLPPSYESHHHHYNPPMVDVSYHVSSKDPSGYSPYDLKMLTDPLTSHIYSPGSSPYVASQYVAVPKGSSYYRPTHAHSSHAQYSPGFSSYKPGTYIAQSSRPYEPKSHHVSSLPKASPTYQSKANSVKPSSYKSKDSYLPAGSKGHSYRPKEDHHHHDHHHHDHDDDYKRRPEPSKSSYTAKPYDRYNKESSKSGYIKGSYTGPTKSYHSKGSHSHKEYTKEPSYLPPYQSPSTTTDSYAKDYRRDRDRDDYKESSYSSKDYPSKDYKDYSSKDYRSKDYPTKDYPSRSKSPDYRVRSKPPGLSSKVEYSGKYESPRDHHHHHHDEDHHDEDGRHSEEYKTSATQHYKSRRPSADKERSRMDVRAEERNKYKEYKPAPVLYSPPRKPEEYENTEEDTGRRDKKYPDSGREEEEARYHYSTLPRHPTANNGRQTSTTMTTSSEEEIDKRRGGRTALPSSGSKVKVESSYLPKPVVSKSTSSSLITGNRYYREAPAVVPSLTVFSASYKS